MAVRITGRGGGGRRKRRSVCMRRNYRGGVVRFHYSSIPLTVVTRRYIRVFARPGHYRRPPFNTAVFSYGNNGTKGAREEWNKEHSCRYSESENFSFLLPFFASLLYEYSWAWIESIITEEVFDFLPNDNWQSSMNELLCMYFIVVETRRDYGFRKTRVIAGRREYIVDF